MGTLQNSRRKPDDCAADQIVSSEFFGEMPTDQILLPIRFFVRSFSGSGKTLVIQARATDSVELIHNKISFITGIPTDEQRLIYNGKQLQTDQTLSKCGVGDDATLQLVGRMRSTSHPDAWQLIDDLVSLIFDLCKCSCPPVFVSSCYDQFRAVPLILPYKDHIKLVLMKFLKLIPEDFPDEVDAHFEVFLSSSAPAALVMLYMSRDHKEVADESIRDFINSFKRILAVTVYHKSASVVFKFCRLLKIVTDVDDDLYWSCRSSLGAIVESAGISCYEDHTMECLKLEHVFPFIHELADELLGSSTKISLTAVSDFRAFMHPVRKLMRWEVPFSFPIAFPLQEDGGSEARFYYSEFIGSLQVMFYQLLEKIEESLKKLESWYGLTEEGKSELKPIGFWWSGYLLILKELHAISKLYKGLPKVFWQRMEQRKASLCFLLVQYSNISEDYTWILQHKEITNFEVRRHMVAVMLPKVSDDSGEWPTMLIDRSKLLEESFQFIGRADPGELRRDLRIKFRYEEAYGFGVFREWFLLVSQAIFNPKNDLFVACTNDRRRFFPNSAVHWSRLSYFSFAGRMVALALMHKIQIGVVFDRVFFLQLAGRSISLEDIRDVDPYLYNSFKQILEMDPDIVDQDTLGLTFTSEVVERGSRKVVELCPNGKYTVVNSKNREKYVHLLIQHRFVATIDKLVARFSQGFADILTTSKLQRKFFRCLVLEDLDRMLGGSENTISVEDWKSHTDYNGYKESDPQISWFWKIVRRMSTEQRRALLFFWISIKYLPLEGFSGLASRLCIYITLDSFDHLPSSRTCFCILRFPPYQSMAIMEDRLHVWTLALWDRLEHGVKVDTVDTTWASDTKLLLVDFLRGEPWSNWMRRN